jgi:hypothetical protein
MYFIYWLFIELFIKNKLINQSSHLKIGGFNMYFYTLSNGEYSDYSYTTIYHEKKFSNKQFAEMYNKALKELGGEYEYHDGVAEKMAELFDFNILEEEFEINVDYGKHKPINIEKVDEESRWFSNENDLF